MQGEMHQESGDNDDTTLMVTLIRSGFVSENNNPSLHLDILLSMQYSRRSLNTYQIKRNFGVTGHMKQVSSRSRNTRHRDSVYEPVYDRRSAAIGN